MQKIAGRLLLQKLMVHFDQPATIADLQYRENHSFFPAPFFHSIAHTEGLSICAATTRGSIGIDIEKNRSIDIALFQPYFTVAEWEWINNDPIAFFQLWTRKESLLKAASKGLHQNELSSIRVINDTVLYENQTFFFHTISLNDNYTCTLTTTFPEKDILVSAIELNR